MTGTTENAVQTLESRQATLLKWLDQTPAITTDEEQRNGENIVINAKAALKEADETRLGLTRPLDEIKANITAFFKPYRDRIEKGLFQWDRAVCQYHEKKRKEAEAARLAIQEQEAKRIAEARQTGEILEPLAVQVPLAIPKTSRVDLGSVSYRDEDDIQIVDAKLVPRDLCEPSLKLIRARVASGIKDIPGVLVSPRLGTSARSARR